LQLELPEGLHNHAEVRAAAKAIVAQTWQCDESEFELLFEPGLRVQSAPRVQVVPVHMYATHLAQIQKKTRHLGLLTGLMALLVVLVWGALVWQGRGQAQTQGQKLAQVTEALRSRAQQARDQQALAATLDRRWNSLAPRLELDLNPIFNTIENIKQPQVRLRGLEMQASPQSLTLSYEMLNMKQVSILNDALASTGEPLSCQLITIQSMGTAVLGLWRCEF
jgi:hypothetical protein